MYRISYQPMNKMTDEGPLIKLTPEKVNLGLVHQNKSSLIERWQRRGYCSDAVRVAEKYIVIAGGDEQLGNNTMRGIISHAFH